MIADCEQGHDWQPVGARRTRCSRCGAIAKREHAGGPIIEFTAGVPDRADLRHKPSGRPSQRHVATPAVERDPWLDEQARRLDAQEDAGREVRPSDTAPAASKDGA